MQTIPVYNIFKKLDLGLLGFKIPKPRGGPKKFVNKYGLTVFKITAHNTQSEPKKL